MATVMSGSANEAASKDEQSTSMNTTLSTTMNNPQP